MLLLVMLAASLVLGGAVAVAVRHGPAADPASPRGATRLVASRARRHPRVARFAADRLDPGSATGLALTIAIGVVLVGAVTMGALAYEVRDSTTGGGLDHTVAEWAATNRSSGGAVLLRVITRLGSTAAVAAVVVLVGVVETVRLRSRALLPFLALVLAGEVLVVDATKALVDRVRPAIDPLVGFSGASFPSGHSAAAAAGYAAVALVVTRGRPRRVQALASGLAVGLAIAVAASRVMLGVHWLTDVVGGLAVGWAWFALCAIAFGGRLLHFGAPVAIAERTEQLAERLGGPFETAGSREAHGSLGSSAST